jgi:hypothetical protein
MKQRISCFAGKGMIKLLTVTHGNPMSGASRRETKCIPK